MKKNFGDFEEVETLENLDAEKKVTEPYAKAKLTEFFESQKSKIFNGVYIAYPHQCLSELYAPAHSSDDILEIYIYSLPKEVDANLPKDAKTLRHERFTFSGKQINCTKGQWDGFVLQDLPKEYTAVTDDTGFPYAVKRDNKLWIAFDVCHGMGVEGDAADKFFEAMFESLADEVINPPSYEELEQRLVKKIQKLVNKSRDASIEAFKNDIRTLESEAKLNEERLTTLIRNVSDKYFQLRLVENSEAKSGQEVIDKIKDFKWVSKVYFEKGMLAVETSDITLGPYNYGKWKILLADGSPQMMHEQWLKEVHPYEYAHHAFCLGGFQDSYVKSTHAGQLDKALAICRMEITNYSTETKMNPLERWLSKTMGKAKFDKIQESIRHDKFKDEVENIMISSINGTAVTYIGIKGKPEGSYAVTGERVVIDYGE